MNARIVKWIILTTVLAVIPLAWAQSGGPYELTWSTIDGGGGQTSRDLY